MTRFEPGSSGIWSDHTLSIVPQPLPLEMYIFTIMLWNRQLLHFKPKSSELSDASNVGGVN